MLLTPVDTVLDRTRALWAPPPELTVSEFADREIIVTSGPLAGTRWQTDFAPYQRGLMNAVHEGAEFIVIMGSSQWGKTSIAANIVAYHIAHNPCEILVVEPTVEPMAKDFAKNRLDPMIRASPKLDAAVDKKRARDASNTTLLKTFRGGFLALAGSNSAASLAARAIMLLILDEPDRYERQLKGEGDTISIAIKRTTTFRSRRRILMTSSPTVVGAPIHTWFERGDQRRYFVPCPGCGHMHPYEWRNVRFEDHDPSTARLVCPECRYAIDEAERVAILSGGEWRASRPDQADASIISFHLWEAYSPLSSLREIVAGFLRARAAQKAGDPTLMHTWQNTTLGEPIEPDQGEGVDQHVLIVRAEPYGAEVDVPAGACLVTAGIDTQDDRLEALVIAWGPGEESWLIDRVRFDGDTSQPAPWRELDKLLEREFRHPAGVKLPIAGSCIDSAGHRTSEVYDYVSRKGALRLHATIGRAGDLPLVKFTPSPRRYGRTEREVPLWTIGVDAAKALWMSRFKVLEPGPGYVHVPQAVWADDELAAQLTSERLVRKFSRGFPVTEWRPTRARNEMLDCAVMALAAMRLLNPKLDVLAAQLGWPKHKPPPVPPKPRWVPPRPADWLKGRR